MVDNSKRKPNSKNENEKKPTLPLAPVRWTAPKSCLSEWSSYKEAKIKITTTQKTEQRENFKLVTLAAEHCPLWGRRRWGHRLCMGGWRRVPFAQSWAPALRTQRENELELNQLWRPWDVVGRQPLIRGVRHVTPSGNGKSWRGAAGSGSSAGLWPGSRGHGEARAMVRAREARASSAAAAPTVLGTAVVSAAFLEFLHQSHTGLQKAQSTGGGEKEMGGPRWSSDSP